LAIRPPWPEKKVNKNLKISELLTNTCFHEIPKTNSYYLVGFFQQKNVIELKITENSEFLLLVFCHNMWWAGQRIQNLSSLTWKKRKLKFQKYISFSSSNTQFYESRISISPIQGVAKCCFFLFNIKCYIGIFGCILILI
jgi:hypothetical protein